MRILQLCKKFPYPPHDGEVIAINSMTAGFHEAGVEVTVLAINTRKHYFDPEQLPESQRQQADYHAVMVDTNIRPLAALLNLFSSQSYNIQRFDNQGFRNKLIELLQQKEFDIIQLEGLYLAPYIDTIRQYAPQSKIAMRAHNVEFEIWERMAVTCANPLKKRYLSLLTRRMRRYEIAQLNRYDLLVPITSKDADFFKQLGATIPMHVCPVGIDLAQFELGTEETDYPSVFHLGAMDWLPNQEGVRWFLQKIWMELQAQFPDVPFYLAGRNMPDEFLNWKMPGVTVVGEVADAKAFLRQHAISVVPLHSGSGMRIKIVEAMALGKTIITTSMGVEGIAAVSGRDLLVADTAPEFASALKRCLENPAFFEQIGKNARIFATENFDYRTISRNLLDFYRLVEAE